MMHFTLKPLLLLASALPFVSATAVPPPNTDALAVDDKSAVNIAGTIEGDVEKRCKICSDRVDTCVRRGHHSREHCRSEQCDVAHNLCSGCRYMLCERLNAHELKKRTYLNDPSTLNTIDSLTIDGEEDGTVTVAAKKRCHICHSEVGTCVWKGHTSVKYCCEEQCRVNPRQCGGCNLSPCAAPNVKSRDDLRAEKSGGTQ